MSDWLTGMMEASGLEVPVPLPDTRPPAASGGSAWYDGMVEAHGGTLPPAYAVPSLLRKYTREENPAGLDRIAEMYPQIDRAELADMGSRAIASRRLEGAEQSPLDYTLRRIPFVGAGYEAGKALRSGRAERRIREGRADQGDYNLAAEQERLGEIEARKGTGEAVVDELTRIPALVTEFAAGGNIVRGMKLPGVLGRAGAAGNAARGALATPLVPSTYLARGAENQRANPDQSVFQSYAPAVALAASQNAVLGQLQNLLSGAPITRAGRILGKTGIGMAESAGADAAATSLDRVTKAITGSSLGLDTQWGVLGSVLRGDEGSKKAAIVQFATFSVFSAMHSGRATVAPELLKKAIETAKPEEIVDVGQKVQEAAKAGPEELAKVEAALPDTPLGDLGRAYVDAVRTDPLIAMGDEGPIPQRQRPGAGRSRLPGLFDRPPEPPAPDAKQEPAAATEPKVDESARPEAPPAEEIAPKLPESEPGAQSLRSEPAFEPGQSPGELAMTERVREMNEKAEKQRIALEARIAAEKASRQARIRADRVANLKKARLKLTVGDSKAVEGRDIDKLAEESFYAREARAEQEGITTIAREIRGRLDPRSFTDNELRELFAMQLGIDPKNEKMILNLPFFKKLFTRRNTRIESFKALRELPRAEQKGDSADQLGAELERKGMLEEGEDLVEAMLVGRVAEISGDARFERQFAERMKAEQEADEAFLASLDPEARAAEEARREQEREEHRKRMTEPFEWEEIGDKGDAWEPPVGEKVWKFADDLEQSAKKEIDEKLGGDVPFMGFDPTFIPPMAKIVAAKIIKGGVLLARGGYTFTRYSADMLDRFGEVIRPHLRTIWDQAQSIAASRSPKPSLKLPGRLSSLRGIHDTALEAREVARAEGEADEARPDVAAAIEAEGRAGLRQAIDRRAIEDAAVRVLRDGLTFEQFAKFVKRGDPVELWAKVQEQADRWRSLRERTGPGEWADLKAELGVDARLPEGLASETAAMQAAMQRVPRPNRAMPDTRPRRSIPMPKIQPRPEPVERMRDAGSEHPSFSGQITAEINRVTWLDAKQRERLIAYLFEGSYERVGEGAGISKQAAHKSILQAFANLKKHVAFFAGWNSVEDIRLAIKQDNRLQRAERILAGTATEADIKAIGGETDMKVMTRLSRLQVQQKREERQYDKDVDALMRLRAKGKPIPADLRRRLKLEEPTDGSGSPRAADAQGTPAAKPRANRQAGLFDQPVAAEEVRAETDPAATAGAEAEAPAAPEVKAQSLRSKVAKSLLDFYEGESGHYWFPTAQFFKDLSRKIFGRGRVNDPDFQPDADPNPDNPASLPSHKVIRKAAYNQVGANNSTPAAIAVLSWAWGRHTADQNANAWKVRVADKLERFNKAFAGMPDWQDRIEEEIRVPGSQHFNAEQNAAVEFWMSAWEKKLRELDAAGIKFYDEDGNRRNVEQMLRDGYFHRGVVDNRSDVEKSFWDAPAGTPKPGFRPAYKKRRAFETAAEGEAAGVEYMNFGDSMAEFIRLADREIVDKNVAEDPMLGGVDVEARLRARYFAENKDILAKLPKDEREQLEGHLVKLARQHAQGNVRIAPAFKSKEYPPESKAQLEAFYGERAGPIVKRAAALNQEVRNLVLGADASYTFLQLLPVMFSNPVRWAQTVAKIPRAFVTGNLLNEIGRKRPEVLEAASLITQSGGTINEPLEGAIAKGKSVVGRLPYVGKTFENVYGRASQAMGQILDLAKIELFLANRPADPKELPRFVEALESSLGQGRMEKLGMSPERALIERVALLAPSFYRAHVGLLKQAMQGGAPGRLARKQLGGLAAGIMGTTIAALYALKATGQISDDEMEERLNPARGKFLMVPVPIGGGKTMEVGFGGIYVSIARTLGNAKRYADGQTDENPASRWYRGHAGSLIRTGWDIGTGEDYLGNPVGTRETVAKSMIPLAAQQGLMGEGNAAQRIAGMATGSLGLRSYAGNESTERVDRIRRAAQEHYGKRYEDLTFSEQARLVRDFAPDKSPASPAAKRRAMLNDELRAQRLRSAVSKSTRKVLDELNAAVPSYEPTLSVRGIPVPLTRSRQDAYEKLLAEEYDRAVASWPMDRLRDAPTKSRAAFIQRSFEAAKARAKSRLVRQK